MACTSVRVVFEIGHEASIRTDKAPTDVFTHSWELFVRGVDNSEIHNFVEKVIFYLHETFQNPKRVIKHPPYVVRELGYAGFPLHVDVYFKSKLEPTKIRFKYHLTLQDAGPPLSKVVREEFVFNNPPEDFRRKLIKGGGVGVGDESASGGHMVVLNSSQSDADHKNSSKNKSSLFDVSSAKKLKKENTPKIEDKLNAKDSFENLFGAPLNTSKIPLLPKSNSKLISEKITQPDKQIHSSKSLKHGISSHKDKDRDRDKEKEKERDKEKHKTKDRDKEKDKNAVKKSKDESLKKEKEKGKEEKIKVLKSSKDESKKNVYHDEKPPKSKVPSAAAAAAVAAAAAPIPAAPSAGEKGVKDAKLEKKDKEKKHKEEKKLKSKEKHSKNGEKKENVDAAKENYATGGGGNRLTGPAGEKQTQSAAAAPPPPPIAAKDENVSVLREEKKSSRRAADEFRDEKAEAKAREKSAAEVKTLFSSNGSSLVNNGVGAMATTAAAQQTAGSLMDGGGVAVAAAAAAAKKDEKHKHHKHKKDKSKKDSKRDKDEKKEKTKVEKEKSTPPRAPAPSQPAAQQPSAALEPTKMVTPPKHDSPKQPANKLDRLFHNCDSEKSDSDSSAMDDDQRPSLAAVKSEPMPSAGAVPSSAPAANVAKQEPLVAETLHNNNLVVKTEELGSREPDSDSLPKKKKSKKSSEDKEAKKRKRKSKDKIGLENVVLPKIGKYENQSSGDAATAAAAKSNSLIEMQQQQHQQQQLQQQQQQQQQHHSTRSESPPSPLSPVGGSVEPKFTDEYVTKLKELQRKIMNLEDNSGLQRIVQVVAETGQYEITTKTFDFDLCLLDESIVQRLSDFFRP